MNHNYDGIQFIYVNMQINNVDMQDIYVNMWDNYVNMQEICQHAR